MPPIFTFVIAGLNPSLRSCILRRAIFRPLAGYLLDTLPKILDVLINRPGVGIRDRHVDRVGRALAIVEPAAGAQRIGQREDVNVSLRVRVRRHGEQVIPAVAEDANAVDPGDGDADLIDVFKHLPRQGEIAVFAEVPHHRPGRRHRQPRAGALHAGRSIKAAESAVEHKDLVSAQVLVAMQND